MTKFLTVRLGFAAVLLLPVGVWAQDAPEATPPPQGKVLFSRDSTTAAVEEAKSDVSAAIAPEVTDAERVALTVLAYDLDVHLTPASAGLAARAGLLVRNDGKEPLTRLVLSISSSLRWESFSGLAFQQHLINTDADHTGGEDEAVVTLPKALGVGETLRITAIYAGTVARSSGRLDRIGAPADQAERADWDEIAVGGTALRGFGEVLWYPVAADRAMLGDGARLFQVVARNRFQAKEAAARLRLAVEYVGEGPHSAYFCGRMERMTAHSENQDVPVAESPGIATAEFASTTIGFRTLSLFVTQKAETESSGGIFSAVTENDAAFKSYEAAAGLVQPMLNEWFGAEGPVTPLRLIDHAGQPFEDGDLLVTPMRDALPPGLAPEMAEALSHVWIKSELPWIEQGLAQFSYLLWLERSAGRELAAQELQREAVPLALAEPMTSGAGQSLIEGRDQVYLRTKAAAVWWMLRDVVGDEALKDVLKNYRREIRGDDDSKRLQAMLERKTGTLLGWFFDDWVYADKGLPDLSIVQVTPRKLTAQGPKGQGWLVAVEVRNDGDAVAEVPVTVRSGTLTATERLRIPGKSSASTRVLFEKTPEEVVVNDGEVPEMRSSRHTFRVTIVNTTK